MPQSPKRVLALGAALAFLAAGCGSSGTLTASAFAQDAKGLQSEAAEGALLAEDAAAGRSTRTYVKQQAAALAETTSKEAATLRTAEPTPQLRLKTRMLAALATQVAADLSRLGAASSAEQGRLARALASAAARSATLGEAA